MGQRLGVLRSDVSRKHMYTWLLATRIMCVSRAEAVVDASGTVRETLRLFLAPALLAPLQPALASGK